MNNYCPVGSKVIITLIEKDRVRKKVKKNEREKKKERERSRENDRKKFRE